MELDLMEWEEKRRMEFGEDDFWRDGRYWVKRIWKGFGVLKEGDRKGIRMEKLTNLKVCAIGRYVVFFDFIMVLSIFTLLITVFIAFLKIVN